jgi:hypothetical protein
MKWYGILLWLFMSVPMLLPAQQFATVTIPCKVLAELDTAIWTNVRISNWQEKPEPPILNLPDFQSCLSTCMNVIDRPYIGYGRTSLYRLRVDEKGKVTHICHQWASENYIDPLVVPCLRELQFEPAGNGEGREPVWIRFPLKLPRQANDTTVLQKDYFYRTH